jgi:hypothetical protein
MNYVRARTGIAAVVSAALISSTAAAAATTITVSTPGDGTGTGSCPASPCSLRQAVNFASPGDTVSVPGGTYTLLAANGPIDVDEALTITGAGAATTTLTAATSSELMDIESDGVVTVSGINFKGGTAPSNGTAGGSGGAIYNTGVLTIASAAFTNNASNGGAYSGSNAGYASYGGAIYNTGVLTITGSSFAGNVTHGGAGVPSGSGGSGSYGGAIYNSTSGRLSVTGTTFENNRAGAGSIGSASGYAPGGGEGGAIYAGWLVTLNNDTFGATTANVAHGGVYTTNSAGSRGEGGAIAFDYANAKLSGNTFTNNIA